MGIPEARIRLERARRKWNNGIKMDLKINGVGGHGLDSCGSGDGLVACCC